MPRRHNCCIDSLCGEGTAINPTQSPLESSFATPLQLSVARGKAGPTRLLLDAKADTTVLYKDGAGLAGLDLLTVAKNRGYEEVAAMLLGDTKKRKG